MDHQEVICEDVRWIDIGEDMIQLQAFVSTTINLRVQQEQRIAPVVLHTHGVHSSGLLLPV
jgi:hypothetical protein